MLEMGPKPEETDRSDEDVARDGQGDCPFAVLSSELVIDEVHEIDEG